MRLFASARLLFALSVATSACSSGTTGFVVPDGGTSPSPTATATSPADPPSEKHDASTGEQPDASPVIDMTPHFDLTLDGKPITITKVTAKLVPASGNAPARSEVAGQYEQDLGHGLTSTATFTIYADATATGIDACGVGGRSALYFFKDTDGALRGVGTSLQGGSCTMNVSTNAAHDFSSGSAMGVLGGTSPKAFTIAWGQSIPKP